MLNFKSVVFVVYNIISKCIKSSYVRNKICYLLNFKTFNMIKDLEKAIYYETIIKAMETEPHTIEVKDWSIADDIEHKMPHMEAHKTDHS